MNFKLISTIGLILLIHSQYVSSADFNLREYFGKSIIREIRSRSTSFGSTLNIFLNGRKYVGNVTEKYSFKYKIGEYIFDESREYESDFTAKTMYIDDLEELYQIAYKERSCENIAQLGNKNVVAESILQNWVPDAAIRLPNENIILGPNYLLFYLLDVYEQKSETINCYDLNDASKLNPLKCVIIIDDQVKIEYFFHEKGKYTMYPYLIKTFDQEFQRYGWQLYKEFEYLEFTPNLNNRQILNFNLPIAFGCKRVDRGTYPKVGMNYGSEFRIDYDVEFNYFYYEDPETKDLRTRSYSNSLYVIDNELNILANHGVNEQNNESMITYFDKETGVFYDDYVEEDKCFRYHQKETDKINWFYVQDLFVKHPEFFYAADNRNKKAKYSFLGNYTVHGTPVFAYEKVFSKFNKQAEKDNEDENRKNINNVYSDHAIVTHYYPQDEFYWHNNEMHFEVPIKIEIRLFDDDLRTEISSLHININNYELDTFKQGIFDISECIQDTDHNLVYFFFDDIENELVKYKDEHEHISEQFRHSLLFISPFRIGQIYSEVDSKTLSVFFKLHDPIDSEAYFSEIPNLAFKEEIENIHKKFNETTKEECARLCVEIKDCAAYTQHSKSSTCKLWAKEGDFDKEMEETKQYNWEKIDTIEDKESVLCRRKNRYVHSKHISNTELANLFKKFVEEKHLSLVLTKHAGLQNDVFFATTFGMQPREKDKKKKKQKILLN